MKFGKSIGTQQEGNADLYYMEYKGLKKRIKDVVAYLKANEISDALTANTLFEEGLSAEIKQVNTCFAKQQKDLLERTASLSDEFQSFGSGPSGSGELPAARPTEAFRYLVDILGDVDQLRKYAVWNAVAVVKILKKRRKQTNFGIEDTAAERAGWLSRQTFFSGSDFAQLHAAIESLGHALVLSELATHDDAVRTPVPAKAEQCPICLDTISDMVELGCRHRFCWKCFVLGPIAAQPEEYRITQCPICRKETAASSSALPLSDDGLANDACSAHAAQASHAGVLGAMSHGSEGLLTRFLHTYFPQGVSKDGGLEPDSDADTGEGCSDRGDGKDRMTGPSEPEMRDIVGELVRAIMDSGDVASGRWLKDDNAPTSNQGGASCSASGNATSSAGDFLKTIPQKSQQERQQLQHAQKLQWLQLASNNDPLALDDTMYCSLCSEPLLMEAVVTTPCKHHFHRVCINRLDLPQCPLCCTGLPFAWFLPSDHPLASSGFRVVPAHKYKPLFAGGPGRGSCGFPLHQPPPANLLGGGGLVMKSYLHRMLPRKDEEDDEAPPETEVSPPASPAVRVAASPALPSRDAEDCSSASESTTDESGSEDGDAPATRRLSSASTRPPRPWIYSAVGRMRRCEASEGGGGYLAAGAAKLAAAAAREGAGGSNAGGSDEGDAQSSNPRGQVLLIGNHL